MALVCQVTRPVRASDSAFWAHSENIIFDHWATELIAKCSKYCAFRCEIGAAATELVVSAIERG